MKKKRENTTPDVARDASGHWLKGQSPNPGGRSNALKEVTAAAQEHGPGVIAFFAKVYADETQDIRARIEAGRLLLERGYGKPVQPVHQTTEPAQFETMSDAELDATLRDLGVPPGPLAH